MQRLFVALVAPSAGESSSVSASSISAPMARLVTVRVPVSSKAIFASSRLNVPGHPRLTCCTLPERPTRTGVSWITHSIVTVDWFPSGQTATFGE